MSQTKNVSITPGGTTPILHVSQYDVGREIIITVTDGTGYYDMTGLNAVFHGTKPSGLGFSVECEIDGHTATLTSTEGMTEEAGAIVAELQITDDDDLVIGTANVILKVETSPHPDGTTDGSVEEVVSTITAIMLKAEGYALGTQDGEDVSSDSEFYHNNAKYYAEQASDYASAAADSSAEAATSESNASTSEENAASSASDAESSASAAAASATAAATSATAAASSATSAGEYATAASSSAADAEESAGEAEGYATAAGTYASNASASEANASAYASNAAASASSAQLSASAAESSATSAATSETNAAASATNAADSASAASTSATNAENSATAASSSATAASTYASNASTYASNASESATAAANSADDAEGYADTASGYATSAAASATAAATSETNAASSATNAATSETNAASSATNAASSETAASSSASAAASSASAAEDSADDASDHALVSEGWAKGTQNGTAVESGDYYEDNAKYYKEQAEELVGDLATEETLSEASDNISDILELLQQIVEEGGTVRLVAIGSKVSGEDTEDAIERLCPDPNHANVVIVDGSFFIYDSGDAEWLTWGGTGDLNGFSFEMNDDDSITFSYINPDDETDTAEIVPMTDTTGQDIAQAILDFGDVVEQIPMYIHGIEEDGLNNIQIAKNDDDQLTVKYTDPDDDTSVTVIAPTETTMAEIADTLADLADAYKSVIIA